jgi:transcriptional regulator with GAF, ATPase, and Fis domain
MLSGTKLPPPEIALRFAPDVRNIFRDYSCPGNVRELRNVLMQAAMLMTGDTSPLRWLIM